MKFIMAFIVVAMRTTVGNPLYIKDLAVPFFFLASGFFLFKKLDLCRPEEESACQKKWLSRIARLYLLWTAIYLPFTVYGFINGGNSFVHSLALFFRNLLFVGENYLSWPLWYLLGMIWAGCMIFLLRKLRVPAWGMLIIGIGLVLVAQLSDLESNGLYHSVFKTTRNGIFMGFPFMVAGGVASKFDAACVSPIVWLAAFLALLVCSKFAAWLVLPAAVALFLFAASVKDISFVSESLSRGLRQLGVVIYLSHMVFAGVLIICGMQKGLALFAITSVCALALAFLMSSPKCEGVVKFLY
ncbi:MAG: acyltransferase [Bacteroidales bacterium]|nr:acyltransferase [Bacteroidales bacterium]